MNPELTTLFAAETVIVELTDKAVAQRDLIFKATSIPLRLQSFCLAAIDIALDNGEVRPGSGDYLVARRQIQERMKLLGMGYSDALVSRRLSELRKLGVCDFTSHSQPDQKSVNHYKIVTFAELITRPPLLKLPSAGIRRNQPKIRAQQELFSSDNNSMLLTGPDDLIMFNERLFNGILDIGMRLSNNDERTSIKVEYEVAGAPLTITSSCSAREGSSLALMTDKRALRVITAYCKKHIELQKLKLRDKHGDAFDRRFVPNLFHIDTHELCELIGIKALSANLDAVVAMMERLSDTTFEVDASKNQWFMDTFSMMFRETDDGQKILSDRYKIQFLSHLESSRENERLTDLFGEDITKLRPRYYTFALENRLFYSMLSDDTNNLFLAHEALSKERSGIVQRFYDWARAYYGGHNKPALEAKWYSLHDLHAHLTPGHRLDNFRNYFLKALKKLSVSDEEWSRKSGKSLIYGYYVYHEYRDGNYYFRIERDRNDPIVGDNSRHNVLLRQRKIGLIN